MKVRVRFQEPTPPQARIEASLKQYNIASWGRQSGKTTFGLRALLKRPHFGPISAKYWYILQTYSACEIAFQRFNKFYRDCPHLFEGRPNYSDLRFRLRRSDRYIWFKSGHNYQDLRGETLHGVLVDELRQQHPYLWSQVVFPMLGRYDGWAYVFSTPNGYDHFFDLWEAAQNNPLWGTFHAPSSEAPWWTEPKLLEARRNSTEAEYAQEYLAEFRDLMSGKIYITHGKHNQLDYTPFVTSDPLRQISDKYPIVLGCDFNLNPMSWHLGQTDRHKWYWFDEIHLRNSHTPEASEVLVERLGRIKQAGLMRYEPNLIICGDSTGKAGQRAAAAQSDYDILLRRLKEAGFTYRNDTPEANPTIKDRIQTVNTRLKAADGNITFFYNPHKCPELKKDFDRTVWKAEGVQDEGPLKERTHAADSVGYPTVKLTPLKSSIEVGKAVVLIR